MDSPLRNMKKLKSQVMHIEMDMFAPGLIFLMAENSSELYEMLLKKIVKVTPEDLKEYKLCYGENNDANGFVFTNKENGLWQMIVYIDRKDWRATLTHESLHAIEQQCERRHIPISKDTEEIRAMMLGHIILQVDEKIKV